MKVSRKSIQVFVDDGRLSVDKFQCKADGTVEFTRSYFYRHGYDQDKFGLYVLKALGKGWELVGTNDEWRAWPKTSYFVATLKRVTYGYDDKGQKFERQPDGEWLKVKG